MSGGIAVGAKAGGREGPVRPMQALERSARLWAGLVLMVFVASHFLNHALGIFGVAVMAEAQTWRVAVWRSWPGTLALFAAVVVHVALALKRVVSRRTWRMPPLEALQIALGLLIPYLLLGHVVATRAASSLAEVDDGYIHVLKNLWPGLASRQSLALVVVWAHGVLGVYYAFHMRRWFQRFRVPLAVLAALVPALALAGFVAAGREAATLPAQARPLTDPQFLTLESVSANGRLAIFAVLALAAGFVAFKVVRGLVAGRHAIRYVGHGEVRARDGLTLLEISRENGIPHPSACGGRARCSSCRVLVTEGYEGLDPPAGLEKRMLERMRAPRQVRLACQIRPKSDLGVRVLLDTRMPSDAAGMGAALNWGVEEEVVIVFADIRGFASLAQNQLPADLFVLLSRIMGDIVQAVEARGGQIAMVQTDGIMAVFGMGGKVRAGARAALNAAADILKAVHLVNKDIRAELPLPIRIGIGVHAGSVMMFRTEDAGGGQRMVVIGEAVVVASRLEEATKELAADCVVSSHAIAVAGLAPPASGELPVHYKNGATPVLAHAFGDRQNLRSFLGRDRAAKDAEPAAAAAG
jgi:adenylate cyclase